PSWSSPLPSPSSLSLPRRAARARTAAGKQRRRRGGGDRARTGGREVLEERDVVVKVSAAGVNRADTVQHQGRYPAPPSASPYSGLECSGTILAFGPNVVVLAGQLLSVPEGVSLTDAAGLPEDVARLLK
uniref:Alcohol dehydrogenase-like N-terminal domain-containing protein n=1 Tax=Oryza nivara TaxID=4536 RepID=A0A0E0HSW1_ORYNI